MHPALNWLQTRALLCIAAHPELDISVRLMRHLRFLGLGKKKKKEREGGKKKKKGFNSECQYPLRVLATWCGEFALPRQVELK